jgi:hypothetical protein
VIDGFAREMRTSIASGLEIAKRNVEGVTCWARVAGGYIFPDYLGGKKFTDLDW